MAISKSELYEEVAKLNNMNCNMINAILNKFNIEEYICKYESGDCGELQRTCGDCIYHFFENFETNKNKVAVVYPKNHGRKLALEHMKTLKQVLGDK